MPHRACRPPWGLPASPLACLVPAPPLTRPPLRPTPAGPRARRGVAPGLGTPLSSRHTHGHTPGARRLPSPSPTAPSASLAAHPPACAPPPPPQAIGRFFMLKERNTYFTQEIRGGSVTFLTVSAAARAGSRLVIMKHAATCPQGAACPGQPACSPSLPPAALLLLPPPAGGLHPGRQQRHPHRHRRCAQLPAPRRPAPLRT